MSSFQQQVADVLAELSGRSINWLSISPESNPQLIQGQFQTDEGEKFGYQLKHTADGAYEYAEEGLERE